METEFMTAFNWFLFWLALTGLILIYVVSLYVIIWWKPKKWEGKARKESRSFRHIVLK